MSTDTAHGHDRERAETAARSGAITAQQVITAQANAGMTADQIEAHHQDVAASLAQRRGDAGRRGVRVEYGFTAEALVGDLRAARARPYARCRAP